MTRMNKLLIAACAVVGVAAFSQAHAQAEFSLTFSDTNGDMGDLILTTTGWDDPTILAITGTFNTTAVTGISGYAAADNILFTDASVPFDFSGISFSTSDDSYNLFDDGSEFGQILDANANPGGGANGPGSFELTGFTLTQIPEPMSGAMFGVGLAAIAVAARRRKAA